MRGRSAVAVGDRDRARARAPHRRRAGGTPRGSRPWSSCPHRSGRAGRTPRPRRPRSRGPPRRRVVAVVLLEPGDAIAGRAAARRVNDPARRRSTARPQQELTAARSASGAVVERDASPASTSASIVRLDLGDGAARDEQLLQRLDLGLLEVAGTDPGEQRARRRRRPGPTRSRAAASACPPAGRRRPACPVTRFLAEHAEQVVAELERLAERAARSR